MKEYELENVPLTVTREDLIAGALVRIRVKVLDDGKHVGDIAPLVQIVERCAVGWVGATVADDSVTWLPPGTRVAIPCREHIAAIIFAPRGPHP